MRRLFPDFLLTLCLFTATVAIGAPALPDDPAERLLLGVLDAAQTGRWDEARIRAERLTREFPDFRAAARLKTHIDNERLPPPTGTRLLAPEEDEYRPDNLDAEIHSRREAAQLAPATGQIAGAVVHLDDTIPYALLVDLSAARIYLLENDDGLGRPVADYYAAMGKQGPGKQFEGDFGTPVGVYRITDYLPDRELPSLYGAGALPLNYPNHWDRLLKRTGYGIWLHGVPRDTYSRPPYSSEGCVTFSNAVFEGLRAFAQPGKTPVIISRKAQWVDPDRQAERAVTLRAAVEQWRRDWESLNFDAYIGHYARDFDNGKQDYKAWRRRKRGVNAGKDYIEVTLENVNLFVYPGEDRLVQVDYRQHYASDNFNASVGKTQYWRKNEDNVWRIVYEGLSK